VNTSNEANGADGLQPAVLLKDRTILYKFRPPLAGGRSALYLHVAWHLLLMEFGNTYNV
jgi:hypothetical protein